MTKSGVELTTEHRKWLEDRGDKATLAVIDAQAARLAELEAENEKLRTTLSNRDAEVAELKRRLEQIAHEIESNFSDVDLVTDETFLGGLRDMARAELAQAKEEG